MTELRVRRPRRATQEREEDHADSRRLNSASGNGRSLAFRTEAGLDVVRSFEVVREIALMLQLGEPDLPQSSVNVDDAYFGDRRNTDTNTASDAVSEMWLKVRRANRLVIVTCCFDYRNLDAVCADFRTGRAAQL